MNLDFFFQRAANAGNRAVCLRYASRLDMYPLLEHPKCGGTWMCRMLAHALGLPFAQYARLPVAMPCVLHGHWSYDKRYRNVTYLTRDGRDVMVSFYFHAIRPPEHRERPATKSGRTRMADRLFGPDTDLDDVRANLPRFIEHMFKNPIGTRDNWRDHNAAWWNKPGVTCVKYEDLRTDCVTALGAVLEGLGQPKPAEKIERAVDEYSMQRMTGRKPGEEQRSSFIRKGVVGDWRNHFTRESAQVFNDLAGDVLVELGYETDRSWADDIE